MIIKAATEKASSTINELRFQSEKIYQSACDAAEDVRAAAIGTVAKTYAGAVLIFDAIKVAGVTVAFITAPVPTMVGLAVLWLLELGLESIKGDIDSILADSKKQRKFTRVVGLLKKYGKIPETAVVETRLVEMSINSTTGTVRGTILRGEFKGIALDTIGEDDLVELASTAPDSDTRSVIEAYISYRKKINSLT